MSIYKDSYETTAGMMLIMTPVEKAIKEAIIKSNLGYVNLGVRNDGNFKPIFIVNGKDSLSDIPLFTHPITILNFQKENYLCTDMRFFVKEGFDEHSGPNNNALNGIRNLTEFNFAKSRAILSLMWLNGEQSRLRNALPLAADVYASWLAESISKNFALDFKDQTTISIISSYFYQSLFMEDDTFDEDTKQRMALFTARSTKAPSALIFEIFDKIGPMSSIDEYCENVVSIVENVRLKTFNRALLLTTIKNSWYGLHAKEIISVALEHPPTWLAIVYTALTERTFKTSMIFRVAERFGKRGGADEFTKAYSNLMSDMLVNSHSSDDVRYRSFE